MRAEGRTQQAVDFGLRATRADPLRPQYWNALGLAYRTANRYQEAASAFEHAVTLAPYDVRYGGNLSRVYVVQLQRGDASSARRAHEVAERDVATDPNNPLAHLTKAVVMQATGDFPEALKAVERALALDQRNNRDIYLTGTQVLLSLGRPTDAIKLARQGVSRIADPLNQVPVRIELARALAANAQFSEALTEINAVLALRPDDPSAQELRSQIQAGTTR